MSMSNFHLCVFCKIVAVILHLSSFVHLCFTAVCFEFFNLIISVVHHQRRSTTIRHHKCEKVKRKIINSAMRSTGSTWANTQMEKCEHDCGAPAIKKWTCTECHRENLVCEFHSSKPCADRACDAIADSIATISIDRASPIPDYTPEGERSSSEDSELVHELIDDALLITTGNRFEVLASPEQTNRSGPRNHITGSNRALSRPSAEDSRYLYNWKGVLHMCGRGRSMQYERLPAQFKKLDLNKHPSNVHRLYSEIWSDRYKEFLDYAYHSRIKPALRRAYETGFRVSFDMKFVQAAFCKFPCNCDAHEPHDFRHEAYRFMEQFKKDLCEKGFKAYSMKNRYTGDSTDNEFPFFFITLDAPLSQ